MKKRNRHAGFTLIEVAVVLALVSVLMGAIWGAAANIWSSSRGNQMQTQIITVVQNMRDHFGPMGRLLGCPSAGLSDYTAVVDDDDRQLIPLDMRSLSTTEGRAINHALGARTGVANAGSFRINCLNPRSFRISVRDLNREHCIKLLRQFPVLSVEMGITRMAGPNGNVNVNARNISSPATVPLPLRVAMANTWCSSVTNNEVSFDFKLSN